MLTKRDRQLLMADFKEVFATKDDLMGFATKHELTSAISDLKSELKGDIQDLRIELKGDIQGLRTELKDEILTFKDAILGEIINLREDFAVLTGYRDMIENHEVRLVRIEKSKIKN